ncbi:RusA family crossover junction endodeoxyribonuclease [Deinococcus radiomollis]|uniref:RusA family crossover junction endodeoxyribonuclease n=1 Tax=Deinococcus radiomollis TaxID=468916 RepID=UPI003892C0F9
MTAPTSERWRSRWQTKDAAERYLNTIKDAHRRYEMADFLGITLPPPIIFDPSLIQPMPAMKFTPALETFPGALCFTLPYPPSLNSIWRSVVLTIKGKPQVRVLLSEKGREYRRSVINQVRQAGNPTTPTGARLALHLHACPPDKRARDLSNLPKALEDALTHAGVWADDSLIDQLTVERGPVVKGGRVAVTITPLDATLFEGQA